MNNKHNCIMLKQYDEVTIEQVKRGQRFDWFLIDAEHEFDSYSILVIYCPFCGVKL